MIYGPTARHTDIMAASTSGPTCPKGIINHRKITAKFNSHKSTRQCIRPENIIYKHDLFKQEHTNDIFTPPYIISSNLNA